MTIQHEIDATARSLNGSSNFPTRPIPTGYGYNYVITLTSPTGKFSPVAETFKFNAYTQGASEDFDGVIKRMVLATQTIDKEVSCCEMAHLGLHCLLDPDWEDSWASSRSMYTRTSECNIVTFTGPAVRYMTKHSRNWHHLTDDYQFTVVASSPWVDPDVDKANNEAYGKWLVEVMARHNEMETHIKKLSNLLSKASV